MFKKLKDKLAEDLKQSPLKNIPSVQQLTQVMSNSTSYNTEISDVVEKEIDQTRASSLNTSEYDSSFITVDLKSPTPPRNRRLSSTSSIASDLFLTYDFTPNRYNLQSDLESNSEFDDGSSIHQFNNITKENLYEKYRIMLQKYHKYRGRFVDLQKFCKELQRENSKAKNVLTESQDKAIRRITELKEQCTLEQEAKAHLEEALRNELEEKDHLIETLNTKIELLKSGKDCDQNSKLLDNFNLISNDSVNSDVENLKSKIKSYEILISKAKNNLTQKNTQIQELNTKIDCNKQTYERKLAKLELDFKSSTERITSLQQEIVLMKRKEEESALTLAENKLAVHKELEAKETLIKNLENKIIEYEKETKKSKAEHKFESSDDSSSGNLIRLQKELAKLKTDLEKSRSLRNNDLALLKQKDTLINQFRATISSSNKELFKLKNELQSFDFQVLSKKNTEKDDFAEEREQNKNTIKKLELSLTKKHKEFSNFRSEKEFEISTLKEKINVLNDKLVSEDRLLSDLRTELEKIKLTKLNNENEKITEVEKTLQTIKDQHSKEMKNREEIETNLKADKIVLEEIVRSTQNELKLLRMESQHFTKKITEYEQKLKQNQDSEQQIIELNERLEKLTNNLNNTKQSVRGMSEKMATLLEQINDLKTKENELLADNRKLKDTVKTLKTFENETKQLRETLQSKNKEIDKLKSFEEEIKKLREDILSKEKIIGNLSKLEHEMKTFQSEIAFKNERIQELENFEKDIISLNEELDSKNKQIVQLKKLENQMKLLKEQLLSKDSLIENLKIFKTQVKSLNEDLSLKNVEIKSLKLSETEKLCTIENKITALNSEISIKNDEIERLRVFESEVKFLNEQLNSENEAVQELKNLNSEIKSLSEEVVNKNTEIQKFENEIKWLKETLSSKDESLEKLEMYKYELKTSNDKLRDKNQEIEKLKDIETKVKSFEENIRSKEEELESLKNIQNEVKILTKTLQSKEITIENLTQQINILNDTVLEKNQEIQSLETFKIQSRQLQKKITAQSVELESRSNKLFSLQKILSNKDGQIEQNKSEIDHLSEIIKTQLDPTKDEIAKLKNHLVNQTVKYQNLVEEHENLKKTAELNGTEFESHMKQSSAETDRLNSEILQHKVKYKELKSFCDKVRSQLEELDNLCNVSKKLILKENERCDEIDQLNGESNRLKIENERLKKQLEQFNISLKNTENKLGNIQNKTLINDQFNNATLLNVQNKISELKNDFVKIKYDLKHDISILKQYCYDYKEDICNTSNKIIQNQVTSCADSESKLKELTAQFDACKSENNSLKNDKKELLIKVNDLSDVLNKLEKKLNSGSTKEYCNNLKNLEDRQEVEIRQIIFDYETKLKRKEKECEILENKLFMISDKENAFALEENYQIIKSLQEEISQKNDAYEKLFEEHKLLELKFEGQQEELKKFYENEIKQKDKKWRGCLDKMLLDVEAKYKDEINELTNEWSKDRKSDLNTWQNENNLKSTNSLKVENDKSMSDCKQNIVSPKEVSSEFMENTAHQSDDAEALKKQVQVLFTELNAYKKSHRKDALSSYNSSRSDMVFDDPVNMEHLRNILYKYMMGVEQSAAARVLAEIVRFDNEQTRQILDKVKPKRSSVVNGNELSTGLMANLQNRSSLFTPSMYPVFLLALKDKFRFNQLRIKKP